ncbi:UNVERIFIED_CONTAM: hypothetical protein PYX00_009135 [Menopon gallinae]|uniref:C2H2-type domain-containing protein n=1 Tax=Menopon gallinae TaxID=328185 RepID=A0AAW2HA80_9NEOP
MYVHNGSWPFKCHICNRGFSKHTNLKNHLFLHTGEYRRKGCLSLRHGSRDIIMAGYVITGSGINVVPNGFYLPG